MRKTRTFFQNKTKTSLLFSIHDGVNEGNTLISDQQLHIIYTTEETTTPPPKKKKSNHLPLMCTIHSLCLKMTLLQP